MIYLLTISFTVLFLLYQKHQYNDLIVFGKYKQRDTNWKLYGWLMKAFVIVLLYFLFPSWKDCLLAGVISWIVFEFGYNKIVLKETWFYVGASSIQDNKLGKRKWWAMGICLIASILIKCLTS